MNLHRGRGEQKKGKESWQGRETPGKLISRSATAGSCNMLYATDLSRASSTAGINMPQQHWRWYWQWQGRVVGWHGRADKMSQRKSSYGLIAPTWCLCKWPGAKNNQRRKKKKTQIWTGFIGFRVPACPQDNSDLNRVYRAKSPHMSSKQLKSAGFIGFRVPACPQDN